MKSKSNHMLTGLIIGIASPPVAFFIFCFFVFSGESAIDLLKGYIGRNVLTHVISLAAIINLPLFFIFLETDKEHTARGIIGATFIYAFVVLTLKLI